MSNEFNEYCSSDTVLKGCSIDQLVAFNNNLFVREIAVSCPVWNICIRGACGIDLGETDMEIFTKRNSIALATSVVARVRNKYLSALSYRISRIIFHSGTSHQDIIHLNRLGVCMSPDSIIKLMPESSLKIIKTNQSIGLMNMLFETVWLIQNLTIQNHKRCS